MAADSTQPRDGTTVSLAVQYEHCGYTGPGAPSEGPHHPPAAACDDARRSLARTATRCTGQYLARDVHKTVAVVCTPVPPRRFITFHMAVARCARELYTGEATMPPRARAATCTAPVPPCRHPGTGADRGLGGHHEFENTTSQ